MGICNIGGNPWKALTQAGFDKFNSCSKVKGTYTYRVIGNVLIYINDGRCRELVLVSAVLDTSLFEQEIASIEEQFFSLFIP